MDETAAALLTLRFRWLCFCSRVAFDDTTGERRQVVEMLLEAGADPTAVSYVEKLQTSPLHLAISRNDDQLLKVQCSPTSFTLQKTGQ